MKFKLELDLNQVCLMHALPSAMQSYKQVGNL